MHCGNVGSDNMYIGDQTNPGHADGVLNTGMIINHILLGHDMDNPLILRNFDGFCRGNHLINISLFDFPVIDCHNAGTVEAFDMVTGNPDIDIRRTQDHNRLILRQVLPPDGSN